MVVGRFPCIHAQIREQMSGPKFNVFTLKFLALKNWVFFMFSGSKKIKKYFLKKEYYATFQCGRYNVFKQKLKKKFDPEKVK